MSPSQHRPRRRPAPLPEYVAGAGRCSAPARSPRPRDGHDHRPGVPDPDAARRGPDPAPRPGSSPALRSPAGRCTLVAWGCCADRRGERFVLLTGLVATAVLGRRRRPRRRPGRCSSLALFLAGAAAASTNAASGRVVVGWFPPRPPRARDGHPPDVAADRRRRRRATRSRWSPTPSASYAALWVPTIACALGGRSSWPSSSIDPPRPPRAAGRGAQPLPRRPLPAPGSTASRCCWSCRSSWCGRSRWSGWSRTAAGHPAAAGGARRRRPGRRRARPDRGRAACPTSSAAGCARCAGSPWPPPRRWRCSA